MRFNDNKLGLNAVSDSEQGRQVGVQRGGGGGVVVGRCAIERVYDEGSRTVPSLECHI